MRIARLTSSIKFKQFVFILLLLVLAQVIIEGGKVNKLYLPAPWDVLLEFKRCLAENILLPNLLLTLQEFGLGYLIAAGLGIALGVLFAICPAVDAFFTPFFSALMSIPKVSIFPLLTIWIGIGFMQKVVIVTLFTFFYIFFSTKSGATETHGNYLKVAKVFRATRAQTIFKVMLPSAVPSIFTGLRVTAATGVTGVIFAEMQASNAGLGFLLSDAAALYNTPRVFVLIVLVTVLAVILVEIVDCIERIFFKKHKAKTNIKSEIPKQ